ncbi:MAG TPA: invasion associated locus B family protein [Stellaceae bacterium]|nr:invasion associated locus B family protein [Stellaceae bacterium]
MLNRSFLYAALTVLALCPAVAAVAAQQNGNAKAGGSQVKRLGGAGAWEAYLDDAQGGKICYLIGKPKKVERGRAKADEVRMSVTHRPSDKVANVVNFILGYRAKKDSDATLDIDGKKFSLFTDKDGAWTRDAATDRAVVTALTKGKSAALKAAPDHGGPTTDVYDLNGFTATVALIDKACGVKR